MLPPLANFPTCAWRLVFAREPLEYGEHDDLVIALALAAWFVRARESMNIREQVENAAGNRDGVLFRQDAQCGAKNPSLTRKLGFLNGQVLPDALKAPSELLVGEIITSQRKHFDHCHL